MNIDSLQQLVRIVFFAVDGYFLGDGAMQTDVAQAAKVFLKAQDRILDIGAFGAWLCYTARPMTERALDETRSIRVCRRFSCIRGSR